jgi:hypothetical protein
MATTSVFQRIYSSGRVKLTSSIMERVDDYCDEQKILQTIGALNEENKAKKEFETRQKQRSERKKKFTKEMNITMRQNLNATVDPADDAGVKIGP